MMYEKQKPLIGIRVTIHLEDIGKEIQVDLIEGQQMVNYPQKLHSFEELRELYESYKQALNTPTVPIWMLLPDEEEALRAINMIKQMLFLSDQKIWECLLAVRNAKRSNFIEAANFIVSVLQMAMAQGVTITEDLLKTISDTVAREPLLIAEDVARIVTKELDETVHIRTDLL